MPIWFFAVGIVHTPVYSTPLPAFVILVFSCCLGACSFILYAHCRYLSFRRVLVCLTCFFFGTALSSFQLSALCRQQLAAQFDGTIHTLQFQVISIPKLSDRSASFIARVISQECKHGADVSNTCPDILNQNIRLSWYYAYREIKAGQIWTASVKLKRPRGFANPKSFDYHAWLLSKDLVATGYIRQKAEQKPILVGGEWVWSQTRQNTKEALLRKSDRSFDRFWAALLVGDRSGVTAEDWLVLQATGTVHLMAISGLHIGLVAFFCYSFGSAFVRLINLVHRGSGERFCRFVPSSLSITGAFYYAALAGFSIPTIRAVTVCIMVHFFMAVGVKVPAMMMLGICIAVVGLLEPLAWESTGFWLSFIAVGILVYCLGGRKGGAVWWSWVKVQVVLSVGMLLPLVFIAQGFSLVGPLANLIAVPLVTLVVVPGLLIASLIQPMSDSLAQWLMACIDSIFTYLWWLLNKLQSLTYARWWPSQRLNLAMLLTGFAGSLYLLSPAGLRLKLLGVIWLIYAGWGRLYPQESFRLTVMDVGQGLAVVVTTPEVSWVYDTGPRFSEQLDSGSRIIAPYLRVLGVAETSVIVSHDDGDHSGGLLGLMSSIPLAQLYYGEPISRLKDQGRPCVEGQMWHSGKLVFEVLWPPKAGSLQSNRASCVVLMSFSEAGQSLRVLFTGDIDRYVERKILGRLPSAVDILIAPHHGSNSSSSTAFIETLKPKHVVFSAGFKNRYRHPSEKVIARYQKIGSILYTTAQDGAISFTLNERDELKIEKTRVSEAKLWYR